MNSKTTNIFEFPSHLGLKKAESDVEPGVVHLPHWLCLHDFHSKINPERVFRMDPPTYSQDIDEESGVRNADKIIEYSIRQAELLSPHLNGETFQIIIGGDCSILIGNAIALRQNGTYALFFLDGHTDYLLPEFSVTKQAAAMELAIVTGLGHPKLTNILSLKPYFKAADVWCVGNRENDPRIIQQIIDSEIQYYDLQTLRKKGIVPCTQQFLKMVEKKDLDGFFIHLDVDVLNDDIMPAVDSRQSGGLYYQELTAILDRLLTSPKAVGIEITILDPNLDKDGKHTTEFVKNIVAVLGRGM